MLHWDGLYSRHRLGPRLHIPLAHPSCSYYYLLSPNILFAHLISCALFILLHILLFISLFLPIYIYALVLCYFYIIYICILLHCPLSGPDLIYISHLIIPCKIYYVTNKETLTLTLTYRSSRLQREMLPRNTSFSPLISFKLPVTFGCTASAKLLTVITDKKHVW